MEAEKESQIVFLTPKGRRVSLRVDENFPSVSDPIRTLAASGGAEGRAFASDYRLPAFVPGAPIFSRIKKGRGLRLSLLLRPAVHARNAVLITALATVSLAAAMEAVSGKKYGIRWVNEVCGAKGDRVATVDAVCSLKPDGYLHYLILEVTAYLSPTDFPQSLSDTVTEVFDGIARGTVGLISEHFLHGFFSTYENLSYDRSFIEDYKKRSLLEGCRATLLQNGKRRRVTILGIDDDARLLVETRKKEVIPVSSRSEILL